VSALEHNTWFTKLRAGHIRLSHEALDRILLVIRRSLSIEELYLDNLGLRGYYFLKTMHKPVLKADTLGIYNNFIQMPYFFHYFQRNE